MKRAVVALLSAGLLASSALAQQGVVEVVNHSSFTINQMFLSSSGTNEWGPDRLADAVLHPGMTFTLFGFACPEPGALYDIRLVDEHGDECTLMQVSLCQEMQTLTLDNESLLRCEGWSH